MQRRVGRGDAVGLLVEEIAPAPDGLAQGKRRRDQVGEGQKAQALDAGVYEVACLCVVPEFQGKGIGTQAIQFLKTYLKDWKRLTLVTPIDKKENVKFYTEKCGFHMESAEMDGTVELTRFVLER